jgi:hypothetical protein
MKLDKNKKEKIRQVLTDYINDLEITDYEIEITGYREHDISYFETNLDKDKMLKDIIKILEED